MVRRQKRIDWQFLRIKMLEMKVKRLQSATKHYAKKCDALMSNNESSDVDIDVSIRIAIDNAFSKGGTRNKNQNPK